MTDVAAIIDRIDRDWVNPPSSQHPVFFVQNATGTAVGSITGSSSDDVIASTGHGLSAGDKIIFTAITGGTGLSTYQTYYVISANTNDFQVSLTSGGSAVTFADFTAGTYQELSAMTASSAEVVVNTDWLSPEEEDRIGVGRLIQIGSEWLRITSVSGSSPSFTLGVSRAHLGTSAAAHADGVEVFLPGEGFISRLSIFEAVADAVDTLWPDLYELASEETSTSVEPIEMPAAMGEVVDVLSLSGGKWFQVGSWNEFQNFPYTATGKAIQLDGVLAGHDAIVVYKKIPTRPTAETDEWADLDVDAAWIRLIVLSAVAELMARYDLESFDTQYITEALEAEGQSPGEGSDIRNSILQLRDFLIQPLKRQLVRKQGDRLLIDKSY